jgi:transcription elongation factor Elf1
MRLHNEEILVSSTSSTTKPGGIKHRFWSVVRATSRTCEICELRTRVIRQTGGLQEVEPSSSFVDEDFVVRLPVENGAAVFSDGSRAEPWDGKTRWQIAVIHLY